MPIQGVVPSSLPLGNGAPVLLFLLKLVPVPEKLGSRMKVLVWVCKSLQCLRVPQVYKELVSRKFTSSKEPPWYLILMYLIMLGRFEVHLPSPTLILLIGAGLLSSNLIWKFLLNLKIS